MTGSGGGLGRSYSLALSRAGARLVINDLGSDSTGRNPGNPAMADAVVAEIKATGGDAVASHHDVADEAGAEGVIGLALTTWGRLDGVVNNAGNVLGTPMASASLGEFRSIIDVHLIGTFLVCRAAARHWMNLAKGGVKVDARLINTTSTAGLWGMPGAAAYCAAKGGILALTQCLTGELAPYGVRVHCIGPGAGTRMNSRRDDDAADQRNLPLRSQMPNADRVAPLIVWLMSDASSDLTGRTFENIGGRVWVLDGWRRAVFARTDPALSTEEQFTVFREAVDRAPEPLGALMAVDPTAVEHPLASAIRPPLHSYPTDEWP